MTHFIPVVALLAGRPEMLARAKDAIRVIQNHDRAEAFGLASARLLESIILGTPPRQAIVATAAALRDSNRELPSSFDEELASGLERALAAKGTTDPATAAGQFGIGCEFPQPLLLAVHMIARLSPASGSPARAAISEYTSNLHHRLFPGMSLAAASVFSCGANADSAGCALHGGCPPEHLPGWR